MNPKIIHPRLTPRCAIIPHPFLIKVPSTTTAYFVEAVDCIYPLPRLTTPKDNALV